MLRTSAGVESHPPSWLSPVRRSSQHAAPSPFRPVTRGYPFHIAGFDHTSRLRLRDQHKHRAEISRLPVGRFRYSLKIIFGYLIDVHHTGRGSTQGYDET